MSAAGPQGHLVLVGMMGTGKTTVGRRLAEVLGRPFLDSDEWVEARTGRTVRELFEATGEPGFRAAESEALADALDDEEPAVIAAAGGAVLDPGNRRLLRAASARGGRVVWLQAGPTVLSARVAAGADHRPLLADDPLGALTRLAEERRPLYVEVADVVVVEDPPGRAPLPVDEVVDAVLEALVELEGLEPGAPDARLGDGAGR